jgi:hypothetical protein
LKHFPSYNHHLAFISSFFQLLSWNPKWPLSLKSQHPGKPFPPR